MKQTESKKASLFSEATPPGESQRFIKNSRYFTICVYGVVMLLITAIIFKAIIDFDKTKAWFGQVLGMLSPFFFGALLAYVLNPLVHTFYKFLGFLQKKAKIKLRHGLHTILSILITYLIIFGCLVLILLYVVPEIAKSFMDFVNYIPTAYDTLMNLLEGLQERYPDLDFELIIDPLNNIIPDLISYLRNLAVNTVPALFTVSVSIVSWIVNLLISIIVSIYMLYDKRRLMHTAWRVICAFVPKKRIPACQKILSECNRLLGNYVVGAFMDATLVGILCFTLMSILQLPYAPIISLVVGLTNMIPYFGPFIGAIPGVVILLFISPIKALTFALMILCMQQIDGLIIAPRILGISTGMRPLWIILAITVGGYLGGVVGMLLGVPTVAVLSYLFDLYLQHRLSKKKISDSQVADLLKGYDLDDE